MKNLAFLLVLVMFVLSACQTDRSISRTELPFATDPSVLRGNWSSTIRDFPAEQDVALNLVDLVATCTGMKDDKCFLYTFEGKVNVGDSDFVPISGQVYSGDLYIYVLRTPPQALTFEASFQLDRAQWSLYGTYRASHYYKPPENELPFYEVNFVVEGKEDEGVFQLQPRP